MDEVGVLDALWLGVYVAVGLWEVLGAWLAVRVGVRVYDGVTVADALDEVEGDADAVAFADDDRTPSPGGTRVGLPDELAEAEALGLALPCACACARTSEDTSTMRAPRRLGTPLVPDVRVLKESAPSW